MDDANSNESLYNFLIKDYVRPRTLVRCENHQSPKKTRRCSCRAAVKTDAQTTATATATATTRRRQQNEKRSCGGGCCEYSRNRCPDRQSYFDVVGRWTRTAIDWAWCRKSHLVVALVSFVLGMCVEDFCQCV